MSPGRESRIQNPESRVRPSRAVSLSGAGAGRHSAFRILDWQSRWRIWSSTVGCCCWLCCFCLNLNFINKSTWRHEALHGVSVRARASGMWLQLASLLGPLNKSRNCFTFIHPPSNPLLSVASKILAKNRRTLICGWPAKERSSLGSV